MIMLTNVFPIQVFSNLMWIIWMCNESNDGMWIDWKQDRSRYIDWSLQMSDIIEYIWWIWIFYWMWYWCIYWMSWLFQWFIILLWSKCWSLFNWNIEIWKREWYHGWKRWIERNWIVIHSEEGILIIHQIPFIFEYMNLLID